MRANQVNPGVAPQRCEKIDQLAAATTVLWRTSPRRNQLERSFFRFPRTRAFLFSSQENYWGAMKIKFIFFWSVLKVISSLKPAGEEETERM